MLRWMLVHRYIPLTWMTRMCFLCANAWFMHLKSDPHNASAVRALLREQWSGVRHVRQPMRPMRPTVGSKPVIRGISGNKSNPMWVMASVELKYVPHWSQSAHKLSGNEIGLWVSLCVGLRCLQWTDSRAQTPDLRVRCVSRSSAVGSLTVSDRLCVPSVNHSDDRQYYRQ